MRPCDGIHEYDPINCKFCRRAKSIAPPRGKLLEPKKPCGCGGNKPIILNHGAGGMGDAIMGLGVVAGLRQEKPDATIQYRCAPDWIPLVELFSGANFVSAHEYDQCREDKIFVSRDLQINLNYANEIMVNRTGGTIYRWERYLKNSKVKKFIIPSLKDEACVRLAGKDFAGFVALAPFSHSAGREYGLDGWLALETLLNREGYRTVVLHDRGDRTERFKSQKVIAASPELLAGTLLNAACTVGVDSGLAHLGSVLGRCVVLCSETRGETVFGAYPSCTVIQGPSPEPERTGWGSPNPESILAAVDRLAIPFLCREKAIPSLDRLIAIRHAVAATNGLRGEVAECGVYMGGTSALIQAIARQPVHLFDTFAGLPEDDPGGHKAGEFACSLEDVKKVVPDGIYHVGIFPDTAPPDLRFRFVHLDMDGFSSTRNSLEYFRTRMVKGGIIVCDDYLWENCPGVERALREAGLPFRQSALYQAIINF